jgi:hypothetical protein
MKKTRKSKLEINSDNQQKLESKRSKEKNQEG